MIVAVSVSFAAQPQKIESKATLEEAAKTVTAVRSIIVDCLLFVIVLLLIVSVVRQMRTRSFIIEPISMPAELIAAGYTPQVVAERILTEIRSLQAATRMRSGVEEGFELSTALVDFAVPSSGVTFRSAIQYARQALNLPDERITGEIVRDSTGGDRPQERLRVVLRARSGRTATAISFGRSESQIADMLKSAAYELAAIADPYLLASYWLSREQSQRTFDTTLELVRRCLTTTAPSKHHAAYVIWGDALTFQRRFEEADEKYRTAASLAPRKSAVYIAWGNRLRQTRQLDEAARKYRMAIRCNWTDGVAWNNLGNVKADQHAYRTAIFCYWRASRLDPKFGRPFSGWGYALMRLGRFDEAERKFRRGMELDPAAGWPHINFARLRRTQKRFDEAIEALTLAVQQETVATDALAVWGDILVDQERFAEAEEKYEAADARNPLIGIRDAGAAFSFSRQRRLDEAIAAARRCIAHNRYHMGAWFSLSQSMERSGREAEAIAVCREILAVDRYQLAAYTVWGVALHRRHRYGDAIAMFRRAASIIVDVWPLTAWAETLVSMRRYSAAERKLREARARNPFESSPLAYQSWLALVVGRRGRALFLARSAYELNPEPYVMRCLSNALEPGEEAAAQLKGSVDAGPPNPRKLAEYARVLRMLPDRRDDARQTLESALSLDSRSVAVLTGLAEWHRDVGSYDRALEYARKAVAAEPWESWPRRLVAELLFRSDKLPVANRWLERCHGRAPFDTDILSLWGDWLIYTDANAAITKFEAIKERDPLDSRAEAGIGRALRTLGKPREAVPHFRKATRVDRYNSRAWEWWVDTLVEIHDYRGAESLARKAFAATRLPVFVVRRARALWLMGRLDEALQVVETVCASHPEDRTAATLRIECLADLGRKDAAVAAIDAAMKNLSLSDVALRCNLADVLVRLELPEQATSAFFDVVRADRRNVRALMGLANIENSRKRHEAAKDLARDVLSKVPDHAAAQVMLAKLEAQPDVAGLLKMFIEKEPRNSRWARELGGHLLAQGDAAGALREFDRAVQIDRWDWRAWAFRARALHEMGKRSASRRALRRAKAIRPHDRFVSETARKISA